MVKRLVLVALFAILISAYFYVGGYAAVVQYLDESKSRVMEFYAQYALLAVLGYFIIYVIATGLSLPAASILTILAGAIFGFWVGLVLVSFASTLGSTIAFLFSRYVFSEWVQNKFGDRLKTINDGVRREGAFYLFALRLVPLFPFFVINAVMGLTPIKTWTFYWVSQLGMLAGTAVYVYAGMQFANIDLADAGSVKILSPGLIAAFLLLGLFPLIAKKILNKLKENRVMKKYRKPRRFERNMVVIGAGAAGLTSALIASTVRAKVTLIEKHKMGGDCLNTGCVPSKALIRSARFVASQKRAAEWGMTSAHVEFDFARVMERVQQVIEKVAPHDSVERYSKMGVECIQGEAKIVSPYEVTVNGRSISSRHIIITTGARPFVPDLPGLKEVGYHTSDTIWSLRELPQRLLVLGAGPIGCELAQCFARLGSRVTLVHRASRIMPREDEDVSAMVMERFREEGIDLRLDHSAESFTDSGGEKTVSCDHQGKKVNIAFDVVLVALGRSANTSGFGLEELGVNLDHRGHVKVNEYMQSNVPTIYACGDVAGPYQFTHTASHQAWFASVNALFGIFKRFKVDYRVIPWATFTDPEVARVGLNEQEAKAAGIAYELTTYGIDDLDRAIADGEDHGFIKVLTVPGKDRILGATIVGEHAGDLISEFVTAMKFNLGLNKILQTIHIYPTMMEANKYLAGNWKKAHKPEKVLRWLEKFHRYRAGGQSATPKKKSNTETVPVK